MQILAGMAILLLLGYLLAWSGSMNTITAWGLCALGIVLFIIQCGRAYWTLRRRNGQMSAGRMNLSWLLVLVMPGLALLLVPSTCPPGTLWRIEAFGYDVLSYHLQIPREWMQAGGMVELEHNVYGYLPGLIETAFFQIAVMRGSILASVYVCQLFSATLAILAAAVVACTVKRLSGSNAATLTAALFVSIPWVMITGSMAYNETAVLAFGAAAMALFLHGPNRRTAAIIGLLIGAATLSKLTAGPMIAFPLGVMLLVYRGQNHTGAIKYWRPDTSTWHHQLQLATVAVLVGLLALSPYLIRNAVWTGNPLFPFAKSVFGSAHWDAELAMRWDRGHGLDLGGGDRVEAFVRQWLLNTGYGAFSNRPTRHEPDNVARFPTEYGVPVLWIAGVIATGLALLNPPTRGKAIAMLGMLGMQLAFWLAVTHLQSRFLLPTLLPVGVLIGIGFGRAESLVKQKMAWAMPAVSAVLVIFLTLTSLTTLWSQTPTVGTANGLKRYEPVFGYIDTMDLISHPINQLPTHSKTLIVADNSMLLYLRRPIGYQSAFDTNELGQILRSVGVSPINEQQAQPVAASLREADYTHVYIGWSELDRLHRTYGFDRDVTPETLRQLIDTGWKPVRTGAFNLFALPMP